MPARVQLVIIGQEGKTYKKKKRKCLLFVFDYSCYYILLWFIKSGKECTIEENMTSPLDPATYTVGNGPV